MKKLNVLVYGAGAIGGYIGASLGVNGHKISFLELPHNIQHLKQNGIRLQVDAKAHHLESASFYASPKEAISHNSFDLAIFALKSFDTDSALKDLEEIQGELPPFLCLQNGVDNEDQIGKIVGPENMISGTVTTAIGRDEIGKLRLERKRGIGIGSEHPLAESIVAAMNQSGLNASMYANSKAMKWSKLLTNLLTNAQCAILDMDPKEILGTFENYRIEMNQLREALQVMRALKLRVVDLPGTPVRAMAFAVKNIPMRVSQPLLLRAAGSGRGGKMPSLHIDRFGGRGMSEVGWLNGAVARWGKQVGIATPTNEKLNNRLQELVDAG